jgi:hypothetical protein
MPDKPFDQTIINPRERPLSSDINQLQSQLYYALRTVLLNWTRGEAGYPTGFLGDGFRLYAAGGMTVGVTAGVGFQRVAGSGALDIGGVVGLNDLSELKPLLLSAAPTFTVPTPDATHPRYDIVEVKYDRRVENPLSRDILNIVTGQFSPTLVPKTLSFLLDGLTSTNGSSPINYKTGTPAASPTLPTTTAGYVRLGHVYVPAGAASITSENIADRRPLLQPDGQLVASWSCQITTSVNPPTIGNVSIIAPPGVEIVLAPWSDPVGGATNPRGVQWILWGPGAWSEPARLHVSYEVGTLNYVSTGIAPYVANSVIGAAGGPKVSFGASADAGVQSILALAGATPSGKKIAIGQPYASGVVWPLFLVGGSVVQAPDFGAPGNVSISCTIRARSGRETP